MQTRTTLPASASYCSRSYRRYTCTEGLVSFNVTCGETDLFISASHDCSPYARQSAEDARSCIQRYAARQPDFITSLTPLPADPDAEPLIQSMLDAARAADVGPMASVAGAIAAFVGTSLLDHCSEVIVENGGDIFIDVTRKTTIGIFAGASPLSEHIGISIEPSPMHKGICTSSGRVGHSLSFGTADAVTVVSDSVSLADAAATSIANRIHSTADISSGIDAAKQINRIEGIIIIKDSDMGVWGDIELVSLQ